MLKLDASLSELQARDEFIHRHIGPDAQQQADMLKLLGLNSLDELIDSTVPSNIRLKQPMDLATPQTEADTLAQLKAIAKQNKLMRNFIGMGYHPTLTPNVILRNVLENPGWYTAYTPYQPEISQGRLEALLNYQQMIMDLTGMDLANASLLDEGTAAAEAMTLLKRCNKKNKSDKFFIANDVHPQTIAVVKTRAETCGFEIVMGAAEELIGQEVYGALVQYPNTYGHITDLKTLTDAAHAQGTLVAVAADIMSLVVLTPPGELGADVVLGNSQRFGVPMGFGGPHAAYFATRDSFKRSTPGRIIGVSIDRHGNQALRMAMQTREQHIRREKATSNICTAQALLAIMASFYAVYHGPQGLKNIANRIHRYTNILAAGLEKLGINSANNSWFDTLTLNVGDQQQAINERALAAEVNLRLIDGDKISISLDELTSTDDIEMLWAIISGACIDFSVEAIDDEIAGNSGIPAAYQRSSDLLTHPVFNQHHSETEMLRYMKRLENKDITLTHSMIALGSCTMKLNATAEMLPVSWPEFANMHPFAPQDQAQGYLTLFKQLERMLEQCTGYDAMSLQPNSGAQGEYAGLLAIMKYHQSRGDHQRNLCLIPSSAHGTNPASAALAGMKIEIVECDKNGNINFEDLKQKAEKHKDDLAALMVTYPSTHGVFEEHITEVCDVIHQYGGQVYLDGANLNAMVGIAAPGKFGADVSHLNLHKTFCIPHGGGGPGMGPIGVKKHLAPFLANNPVQPIEGLDINNDVVSSATWGSASILPITWMYISMMGEQGLKNATQVAILSANYIAKRLESHYPILFTGRNNRVAHECIIDIRPLKESTGIGGEDIAKRLNDYGFHAPTMSFPVPGTLMIEPTESEPKEELDRFIDAMISIRKEIAMVENGELTLESNPVVNAPHTAAELSNDEWPHSYSRKLAAYPIDGMEFSKYWPPVARIDNAYGDKNLVCSCPSIDSWREG
ncbi:aminomethyl-transferring glycine dehydrogenase [Dasania sp. GY-MA-18]|uniref:Glycine dehydrogenase (decarboxylating) n=1 Tax=Dasania phycosphaerae TaxID=2950436 RepID=A0A9J6RP47_9GAMM|nr:MULTISPECIES: aminomethyl-transferring glycine dehydrogenase [Dasania]MCR8923526.1 aminomethyl-transferring glycine dehydrogenase [Dasania sp. GY-MA-18]MCZ0865960.1 aminomethyl-transferring glycine dehydrogenase [Dasania phycosphaerae]MCZ0869684.1 aminomethyl-transferring glycine dehydrogenase [Dasania phycosphaerae]